MKVMCDLYREHISSPKDLAESERNETVIIRKKTERTEEKMTRKVCVNFYEIYNQNAIRGWKTVFQTLQQLRVWV